MKSLEVEDSEQLHAAFLVYMDLKEGEFDNTLWERDLMWRMESVILAIKNSTMP